MIKLAAMMMSTTAHHPARDPDTRRSLIKYAMSQIPCAAQPTATM